MGLHDAEGPSWGEYPGQLGELQRQLEWANSRRNESIELQKKMIKRIKNLESALWDVLAQVRDDNPAVSLARKILGEKV